MTMDENKNAGVATDSALAAGSDFDYNGKIRNLEWERDKLLIALHDAINRPMGTVPDSAMEFYDPSYYEDELNELIEKGTDAWKGVDVSEHIN